MADRLEVLPVPGIGDVTPGLDLAGAIVAAAPWLRDGDVLVVTSKIVSKTEGRLVDVPAGGPEREAAREEILAAETARPVARRGSTRIVQTHHGLVMASAGIDASNVDRSRLVLLPKDPDASARHLRAGVRERAGVNVAVVISDTMGRPWRTGLTDVAIGSAGIDPVRDYRGEIDPYGNELRITQMAVIDELAAAAELVKGKCAGIPVAVVRGLLAEPPSGDADGAAALVRGAAHDLFSLGTAEARAAGLREAACLPQRPDFGAGEVDPGAVTRAVDSVGPVLAGRVLFSLVDRVDDRGELPDHTTHVIACRVTGPAGPGRLIDLGQAVHRLRCALAAEGLATAWLPPRAADADGGGLVAVGLVPVGPA